MLSGRAGGRSARCNGLIMIHYQDERTKIETIGRAVSILPSPEHDPVRAAELHTLFPVADGWMHFHFGVGQRANTSEERSTIVRQAAAVLVP
jgi:hypothetical protein